MTDRPSHREEGETPSEPSARIDGYRMLRTIGHGGMSTVYLARQEALGRDVAVKVMLPEALEDETSRRRFENETRTIARLEHPNIVGIYEVGRTREGLPYYAMPYLRRGHLGQRDGSRNHATARQTLRALLQALDYAHARGVVHRDVKAENVLFDEAERPMLADFGIALRRGYGTRVTTAGLAVGSTAYMAPEQARGQNVDARADLYAVGVLAWEMIAGSLPYNAADALSMAIKHAQDPIPRLPPELRHWQKFMDKALAKTPAQRFQGAQQMLDALQQVPLRSAGASLSTGLGGALRRIRQWPRAAWIGGGLAAAAIAGIAVTTLGGGGGEDDFFRSGVATVATGAPRDEAGGNPSGLPVPGLPDGAIFPTDPSDSMLRTAPESPAERFVVAAEEHVRRGRLASPAGNNAYDSVLAGFRADRNHMRMGATIAALAEALSTRAAQRIEAGDLEDARDDVERVQRLAKATAPLGNAALAGLSPRTGKALRKRMDALAAKYDGTGALAIAQAAKALGADNATASALLARAQSVPKPGQAATSGELAGMTILRSGDRTVAASREGTSRDDYASFASATGRAPALCRERASLLRIVAPRTWQAPGFAQSPGQPVVCVSWSDAEAYARWMSQRTGHRWRLPTGDEARTAALSAGAKPVAEWVSDCAGGCQRRIATGRSWRGVSGNRPLDVARGYDDVGFRLVREL